MKDDIICELDRAEEAGRIDPLVRLVRYNPELREELVDHYVEILLMEWRAAHDREPPCPPIDEAEAVRSLARFQRDRGPSRRPLRTLGAVGKSFPSPSS
ncbi:hypothetical protein ACLBX9_07200 [Methylobacterium sp. A49B]